MTHDDIDLTGSKVLLVDDTPANMDVLRGILEGEGYRIFAAPSGEVALKIAPRTLPDIILLDVMMPGIDGLETCRRLKKDPKTKEIPVVFVSAKTAIEDIIDGFKVGAVDYISKPIRREEVVVRVHTHLETVALFRQQEKLTEELVHSEKMASLGTLTAGVAHEINNPNNFVHVSADNLRADLEKLNRFIIDLAGENADESVLDSFSQQFDELYHHIATIKDGSNRIKTIVQDLRAFTQLDSHCKKQVNISDCLQSTVNLVRTKFEKTAEFFTDFNEDLPLLCYPAQLNQVFMILIVNACDAIKLKQQSQGIDEIAERGKVIIKCTGQDNAILVTVEDNGCGIDEQAMKKLFEPFYTTKEVGEGTGLGLSIAYGIVQNHDGDLTAESTPAKGSKFTVKLPKAGGCSI